MISAFVIVVNEAVFPDFADIIQVGLSGCGGHWTLTMGKPVPRVNFFLQAIGWWFLGAACNYSGTKVHGHVKIVTRFPASFIGSKLSPLPCWLIWAILNLQCFFLSNTFSLSRTYWRLFHFHYSLWLENVNCMFGQVTLLFLWQATIVFAFQMWQTIFLNAFQMTSWIRN